jgi:hypothetical protein
VSAGLHSDLIVEHVRIDLDAQSLADARVTSDLWKGARVPLEALTGADRAWLFSLLQRVANAVGARAGAWVLAGQTLTRADGSDARDVGDAVGVRTFLDVVAGTLLIDPNARAMQTRGKGDSPA